MVRAAWLELEVGGVFDGRSFSMSQVQGLRLGWRLGLRV